MHEHETMRFPITEGWWCWRELYGCGWTIYHCNDVVRGDQLGVAYLPCHGISPPQESWRYHFAFGILFDPALVTASAIHLLDCIIYKFTRPFSCNGCGTCGMDKKHCRENTTFSYPSNSRCNMLLPACFVLGLSTEIQYSVLHISKQLPQWGSFFASMEQSIFFATTTPILLSAVTHISLPCCNHILRLPFHHYCFWETAFTSTFIEYAHLLRNVIRSTNDDVLGCEEDSGEKKWQYPPEIRGCSSFACMAEEEMWARQGHCMSPPTT